MAPTVSSVCSHDCPDACSVLIDVEGDGEDRRAMRFRGDPDHPFTRGFLCGKVNAYEQIVYSPDRVLHPLRRTGPKGSGQFEPISWDRAIARIAEEIRATRASHGGESIFQYFYAGTMGQVHRFAGDALFHRLGATRQLANICYFGADEGYRVTVGSGYGLDPEDVVHSDLIVVWGANVVTTQVHLIPFFDEARKNGARLVVVDPYRNRTARSADEWISVEPGTDTALALSMLHVLERDGRLDSSFLDRRTVGFDALSRDVLPKYAPSRAETITGVEAATIERIAREIADARAPAIKVGIGLGRSSHGASAVRAICALAGGVGAYEKLGGGVLYDTGCEFRFNLDPIRRPDWLERDTRVVPQTDLGPLLAPTGHPDRLDLEGPPIRFLYVHGANPLATCPLQSVVRSGLERDDLFTVVHERFLTDTARYADLVLPAPTFAETSDLFKSYGHLHLKFAHRAIEPLGESRANLDVVQAIGKELGFDDPWFDRDVEGLVREVIDRTDHPNFAGIDADEVFAGKPFRLALPRGQSGFAERFATPSGKLEFRSEELALAGLPAVVDYRGDPFATDLAKYPLRLITPPAHAFLNSSFVSEEASRKKEGGTPRVLVHPRDAVCADGGSVESGDTVRLTNELGSVELEAKVTEDTRPGTIVAEGIWWPHHSQGGAGINTLTSNRLTDLGGGSTFHDNRVALRRLRSSAPRNR